MSAENLELMSKSIEFLTQFRDKNEEKFRSITQLSMVHKIYEKLLLITGTNLTIADISIRPLYQVHGAVWFEELFNLPNLEVSILVFI